MVIAANHRPAEMGRFRLGDPHPEAELRECVAMALTCHLVG